MPRADWLRDIAVHHFPVPTSTNALGAKGMGESCCSGSLPVLVDATIDALRPLGMNHLDMQFTPSKLWHTVRDAR